MYKIYIPIVVFVSILLVLFFQFLTGTRLVIDMSKASSLDNISVNVNGEVYLLKSDEESSKTLQNQIGSKEIIVKSPGYSTFTTTVDTFWRGEKLVEVDFKEIDAKETAKYIINKSSLTTQTIVESKYHQNNEWISFRVQSAFSDLLIDTYIAKYEVLLGDWVVLNDDNLFENSLSNPTYEIPESVLKELELYEQ